MTINPKNIRYPDHKHICHPPPRVYNHSPSPHVLNIKSSTPFPSALKRLRTLLDLHNVRPNKRGQLIKSNSAGKKGLGRGMSKDVEYVCIKAMGKAISKAINLGWELKREGNRVEFSTATVTVLDEFRDKKEDEDDILQKRRVSSIEVRVWPF
ncbi:ribonuclease P/MRP protein subunit [Martiniozyma asiatica (nom. inval.)]|nr:ribonuclease P/MRP protein subunit [Martiniozyma asiatica]